VEGILKISIGIKEFLVSLAFLVLASLSFADQSEESAAISSAEYFLQLVDSSRYAESWDATSNFFKQQISKQQWVDQLEGLRPTFGNIITREVKNKNHTTSLPGAPDGEYVVIQFSTSFENKIIAIETVTSMLDSDGEWRVSGYYVR